MPKTKRSLQRTELKISVPTQSISKCINEREKKNPKPFVQLRVKQ